MVCTQNHKLHLNCIYNYQKFDLKTFDGLSLQQTDSSKQIKTMRNKAHYEI